MILYFIAIFFLQIFSSISLLRSVTTGYTTNAILIATVSVIVAHTKTDKADCKVIATAIFVYRLSLYHLRTLLFVLH